MTPRIFISISTKSGLADDSCALELAAAARRIAADSAPTAIVAGFGAELDGACEALRASCVEVWKIAHEALAHPNAELVRQALVAVVPRGSIVLAAHDHFGLDLAPGLSVKLDAAYLPDIVGMDAVEGATLRAVRQEFGGQFSAHVECKIDCGAVVTVRPGAFKPADVPPAHGIVIDKSSEAGALCARRQYVETMVAEIGDVDITRQDVLVSVGRGIQEQENLGIAEELAEALGGAVSCSRPVVDAKWMPKSRQVGTSGQTVRPKVYLACGISGAFQHLAGIKGNPLIVAINKNPKAPIFQVADVGIVADLLEFLPVLTAKARELSPAGTAVGRRA